MNDPSHIKVAELLCGNRLNPQALSHIPSEICPQDIADGYAIQSLLHNSLEASGMGRSVGYKIGCTTSVMQEYLNINQPCAGGIMEQTVYDNGAVLEHSAYVKVGVECEIAVLLSHDLDATGDKFTIESVSGAIGACMAAIEIVDDRYVDYGSMNTPSLVADDFFGAGCVLGQKYSGWRDPDLRNITGRMLVNDVEIGRGKGAAVLGHPLQAVAWLANHLAERGEKLHAGEFILTGSLVQTYDPGRDDLVGVEIDGFGSLSVRFS